MTTILTKKKDTSGAPAPGDLTNAAGGAELAVNTADKRLYTKDSGGNVVEIGTNPTILNIDNIQIDGNTISSTNANGNIIIAPNGTGDVQLDADTVRVGDSNTAAIITTNGTGDITINTNGGTNSGSIAIANGVNGNINVYPNGTGSINLGSASTAGVVVNGTIKSNLIFTDNTYDIGASGANRPRDMFLSRNLTVGGTLTLAGGVNLNGNVTIGDSSADTLTVNSTITSNLLFTDNTYDIGASGATRPRNIYSAGSIYTGRAGVGAFLISGYNSEIIGGVDASGFYFAGGNGVAPATPILFGDTGITYYNFNASASAAFNYRFNGTNRFAFSSAFMGYGTVSSAYVNGMSRVFQVGAIAADEAVGVELVGNRSGYNQTVGRISAYNTNSSTEVTRLEFTTGTASTSAGQHRFYVDGSGSTSAILNNAGLGIGPAVIPSFNLDVGNGATAGNGIVRLNGRNVASEGPYIRFDRASTQLAIIGTQSAIIGSSTSDNLMLWTKSGTGLSIATGGNTSAPAFYIGTGQNVNIGSGSSVNQDFGYSLGVAEGAKAQITALSTASYAAGVGGAITLGGNYRATGDFSGFVRIASEKTNATNGDYSYNLSFYTTQYAGATLGVKAMTIFDSGAITLYNTGTGMTFSSSGGNGLRIYGASGTSQWDMYLNSTNLRFSNNSATTGSRLVVDQGITSSGSNLTAANNNTNDTMYAFYTAANNSANFKGLTMGSSGGEYGSVGYGVSFTGSNGTYYRFAADTASMIQFANGGIQTYTAPAGSGGSSITFTTGPYVSLYGTSWTNSSDERRKVILEPITNALAKVRAVRKVIGRFIDDTEDKRRSFFIAQDFLQHFPEVVDVPEKDFDERTGKQLWMGIQYTETIPLIAAALEELADAFDAYVANHP